MNIILKYAILLSVVLFSACNKDKANLKITDFSKKQTVVLKPYKFYPYAMLKIRVKGFVNDTVKINYDLYGNSNFYLNGKIDTILVSTDYYGETPVTLTFNPYKATEGELEINIKL